jgi:hypothetical protein
VVAVVVLRVGGLGVGNVDRSGLRHRYG